MLGDAGHAEIVADAADAEDERVVRKHPGRKHLLAIVVDDRGEPHFAPRAIEPGEGAEAEAEVMPVRDQEVIEAVEVGVHAPRRDFMQQRFPQVRREAVDERHGGPSAAAQRVAQLGGERQPGGAAADDHDPVRNDRGRIHHCQL